MNKLFLYFAIFAVLLSGCAVEESFCVTNEECGLGFECDIPTGICVELGTGGDNSLSDYDSSATSDTAAADKDLGGSDTVTDSAGDKDSVSGDSSDTAADKDAATSADKDTTKTDTDTAAQDNTVQDNIVQDNTVQDNTVNDTADNEAADEDIVEVDNYTPPDMDGPGSPCGTKKCQHGTCNAGTGTCDCDTGYDGSECNSCYPGYINFKGDGICEPKNCQNATDPIYGWLDCHGHGTCQYSGAPFDADCDCDFYWTDGAGGECSFCMASDPNDCN